MRVELQDALELPAGYNPRTLQWAADAARRPALRRRQRRRAGAGGAAAHPHGRLQLHAGARHLRRHRPAQRSSTSSGSTAKPVSASTSPPRSSSSCARSTCRRASSPATRAPTRWWSTATTSCARAMRTPGPNTGRKASAGCAPTRPPRSRPTASSAASTCSRSRGFVAGTLNALNPDLLAQLRGALGGGQQPLEPVGAELLARPAAADAARPRPQQRELARPGAAADRVADHAGAGRGAVGLVGTAPAGPVGAAARAHAPRARQAPASTRRRTPGRASSPRSVRGRGGGDALAAWLLALDAARYGRAASARPAAGTWREFIAAGACAANSR